MACSVLTLRLEAWPSKHSSLSALLHTRMKVLHDAGWRVLSLVIVDEENWARMESISSKTTAEYLGRKALIRHRDSGEMIRNLT